MAFHVLQVWAPSRVSLNEAWAMATTFSCWGCAESGASGRSADVMPGRWAGVSGAVGGCVCANAVIADNSNPVVSNPRIERPSRLCSIVRGGQRMPLVLYMEEGVVDVGPEFLEDEGARVDADVDPPF